MKKFIKCSRNEFLKRNDELTLVGWIHLDCETRNVMTNLSTKTKYKQMSAEC